MELIGKMLQERTFTETYLPLTMEMANHVKELLLPMLDMFPRTWPFEDRVLAWLVPSLADDIKVFHDSFGDALNDVFQDHQINHMDNTFLNILIKRLKSINPEIIAIIRRQDLLWTCL
jgi:hypothetical protein